MRHHSSHHSSVSPVADQYAPFSRIWFGLLSVLLVSLLAVPAGGAESPTLEIKLIPAVDNGDWTPITLAHNYASMVAVCSPSYDSNSPSLVVRLRNAQGSSFEVRVDRTDGSTAPIAPVAVQCAVLEEGVYTAAQHGIQKPSSSIRPLRIGSPAGLQKGVPIPTATPTPSW
jgi:hypothetical protein